MVEEKGLLQSPLIAGASGYKDRVIPFVVPYVTFRWEPFGALLFNPYFGTELRLDAVEARVIGLCDGRRTYGEIRDSAPTYLSLSRDEAYRAMSRALRKASGIGAIDFSDRPTLNAGMTVQAEASSQSASCLSSPKRVVWEVTHRCNLSCPHCVVDAGRSSSGELTTGEGLALIKALEDAKVLQLLLSGGEPLLREDIGTLLEYAAGTKMRVSFVTNGLKLPGPLVRKLQELPVFEAQVSLDGIGERHDRFRGRRGAFSAACRSITRLKEAGLAVTLCYTATRENLPDLDALIDLAASLGCREFKATPYIPGGRGRRHSGRYCLGAAERYHLAEKLSTRHRELKSQMHVTLGGCFTFLLDGLATPSASDGPMGCSAGGDTLCIGADGTTYPCAFLRDHPLGNVLRDGLREIWLGSPVLHTLRSLRKRDMAEPCASCPYAPLFCGGGCRASAYYARGDLKAADPGCFRPLAEEL